MDKARTFTKDYANVAVVGIWLLPVQNKQAII
jgi:hypothetical protein